MLKQFNFTRPDHWSLMAFLLPFYLYLATLAPSVTMADSGQLMTAVWHLGSTSPPSHPLLYLYLKPFTWLPIGNFAFRINLANAVAASVACLICYHLVVTFLLKYSLVEDKGLNLCIKRIFGLVSGLLLATSPVLWLSVNEGGSEPLTLLLVALFLFTLLKWRISAEENIDTPIYLYLAAFCCGLAFCADRFVILLLPGMLLFVFVKMPTMACRYKQLLTVFVCLLAGSGFYLYIPLRAAMGAEQLWSGTTQLKAPLKMLFHTTDITTATIRSIPLLIKQLAGLNIPYQLGWVGFVLFLCGIWFCIVKERGFLLIFLAALVAYWLLVVGYLNPAPEAIAQTDRLYAPLYLFASIMVGLGVFELGNLLLHKTRLRDSLKLKHGFLIAVFLLLLPFGRLCFGLADADQHDNYLAHDYGTNVLYNLPENSLLFTEDHATAFPLWYLQTVEKIRTDVDLAHIPLLTAKWHREQLWRLKPYLDAGPTRAVPAETVFRSLLVYLAGERPLLIDFAARQKMRWLEEYLQQQGLLFEIPAAGQISTNEMPHLWDLYNLSRLHPKRRQPDDDSHKLLITYAYCLMQSAEDLARRGHIINAEKLLQQAMVIMPEWNEYLQKLANRYGIHEKKENKQQK